MSKTIVKEEMVKKSNQPQNEIREVELVDLRVWYDKLGDNPSNELMEEFHNEVQNWNLYDLTYHLNENGRYKWVREYGLTLPHILQYLKDYYPPYRFFNDKEYKVSDFTLTPHNEEFRSKKLNSGRFQGESDRSGTYQYIQLMEFGKLMGIDKKKK